MVVIFCLYLDPEILPREAAITHQLAALTAASFNQGKGPCRASLNPLLGSYKIWSEVIFLQMVRLTSHTVKNFVSTLRNFWSRLSVSDFVKKNAFILKLVLLRMHLMYLIFCVYFF